MTVKIKTAEFEISAPNAEEVVKVMRELYPKEIMGEMLIESDDVYCEECGCKEIEMSGRLMFKCANCGHQFSMLY